MQEAGKPPDSRQMFGWCGVVADLIKLPSAEVLASLQNAGQRAGFTPSESQTTAWKNCLSVLRAALNKAAGAQPVLLDWSLVLEFELPRERGRRPDVVLLGGAVILVLEFKDFREPLPAHIDQVAAYARDLRHYHSKCREKEVLPVLVLTQAMGQFESTSAVQISTPSELADLISKAVLRDGARPLIEAAQWVEGEYSPLPTLINAARRIFLHEPLPALRRAHSAGIPWTLKYLEAVAEAARQSGERHLALITGVPGAGKTLVGLQFVYQRHFDGKCGEKHAVFLSGNGPLVKVLQHALKSSVFVQDVHGFLRQYGGHGSQLPTEHIWVYDEAQRAWDADRVAEKRGHATSEPEDFIKIGNRAMGWAFMVGLVGEGQEIHLGEEAGIRQWNDAIAEAGGEWTVHCPPKLVPTFRAAKKVNSEPVLDLTESLRSHLADDVQRWVGLVLTGNFSEAAKLAPRMAAQGFAMYLTSDLEEAKNYVRERYAGEVDKRFGLLASSKGSNLPQFGVQNSFGYTRNLREGPWYNDPPESKYSCCQLRDVATEFACQGLELDMPIVCWGSDLRLEEGSWKTPRVTARNMAKDPRQLRLNSYRVLLSRGRDGVVLYVPPEPKMQETFAALRRAGARALLMRVDQQAIG